MFPRGFGNCSSGGKVIWEKENINRRLICGTIITVRARGTRNFIKKLCLLYLLLPSPQSSPWVSCPVPVPTCSLHTVQYRRNALGQFLERCPNDGIIYHMRRFGVAIHLVPTACHKPSFRKHLQNESWQVQILENMTFTVFIIYLF